MRECHVKTQKCDKISIMCIICINQLVRAYHVYHVYDVSYLSNVTNVIVYSHICPKNVTNLFVSVSVAADEVPRVLDSGGWDPPALFATCGRSRILHDVPVCEILA